MMTRTDQATEGLIIRARGGIVRVKDGHDTWLCLECNWVMALRDMNKLPPIVKDDGGMLAYSELCRRVLGPVASVQGTSRGFWQWLVSRAFGSGLIDSTKSFHL